LVALLAFKIWYFRVKDMIELEERQIHFEEHFDSSQNRGCIKFKVDDAEGSNWRFSKHNRIDVYKRGKCRGLSTKSRKRFLDSFQRIDYDKMTHNDSLKVKFITLTYGQEFPNIEEAKIHFDKLEKRIRYRYPKASCFWREEDQKRGAPHFHLVYFNLPYLPKEELKRMWGQIIGEKYWDCIDKHTKQPKTPEEPFTRIETIRSVRGCMSYIAKYVSKNDGSKGENSDPRALAGFNSLPYLEKRAIEDYFEVFEMIIRRAYEDGFHFEKITLDPSEGIHFQCIGDALNQYMTDAERDLLMPPIGRVWGKRNQKAMKFMPYRKGAIQYSKDVLYALKSFSAELRKDCPFYLKNADGGFTLYVNSALEREWFFKTMEKMIDKERKTQPKKLEQKPEMADIINQKYFEAV